MCATLRCLALWVSLLLMPASGWAANYLFPGNLPSGCSSTGTYTFSCGALTLANADTVTIVNKPATITFTSHLTTNGADINPTGTAADLTMNIAGALHTASGAVVVANVKAGSVSDAGGASFKGNLVTNAGGSITLGNASTVVGNLNTSAGGGFITLGTNSVVTGSLTSAGGTVILYSGSQVTSSIVSGSGFIYLYDDTVVGGTVSCSCNLYAYNRVAVAGSVSPALFDNGGGLNANFGAITTSTGYIILGIGGTANGALTSSGGDNVIVYGNATVTGGVTTSADIWIYGGGNVGGDITGRTVDASGTASSLGGSVSATTGAVTIGQNTSVAGSITSTSGAITLYSGASVGGGVTCDCGFTVSSSNITGPVWVGSFTDYGSSTFGATVATSGSASLGSGSRVTGDLSSSGSWVTLNANANVSQCTRARDGTDNITLHSGSRSGGVCCSTSCSTSCVTNWSGAAMPSACSSSLPPKMAEYRFEETSYVNAPSEVVDSSGFGHHGTTVGAVSSTASGKICRGLSIPQNTTSTVQALNTGLGVNSIGDSGTIAFWYKAVASGSAHRNLFDASVNSSGDFYLYRSGSGSAVDLNFVLKGNCFLLCGNGIVTKTSAMSDGTWTHVAVTWSIAYLNSRMTMYVNGVQVATKTYVTLDSALSSSIGTLFFGDQSSSYAGDSFNSAYGTFDQIQIFNTALTATEVASVYTVSPACSSLDHLEITTPSATATDGVSTTFTIKACATADCSTPYTGGVTGTVTLTGTGVTPTFTVGPGFSMASGASTATVVASATPSGSLTVGVTSVSPSPAGIPPLYCGLGATASSGGSCVLNIAAALHHLAVTSVSASGMTCVPNTFTLTACGNAACSVPYTSGLSGSLSVAGTGLSVVYPSGAGFSMASGASSATVAAQVVTAGTATVGVSGLSVTPTGSPGTYCGMGTAATSGGSCAFTSALAGFLVVAPNHVAETTSSVTVTAVRSTDQAPGVCLPAFTVAKTVTLKCSYANPTTGSLPARVGGSALNAPGNTAAACDASGRALSLSFNASGVATAALAYADAGKLNLTANYVGSGSDAGLTMTGTGSFTTAPASFSFSGITAAPIRAGSPFSATVTALNNAGSVTTNFGGELAPEAATLTYTRHQPTGTGSQAGTFSGSLGAFSAGVANASTLAWTEVGNGDLTATLTSGNYLGTGLTVTGTTGSAGAVGRFIPHHFSVATAAACGGFSYAGQPYATTLTALNAAGNRTYNYDGGGALSPAFAKLVTLSDVNGLGLGSLSGASVAAASFATGVALVNPSYAFSNKLTATQTLTLRATDADGVTSQGYAEGSMALRSGRLVMSNAFGSEKSPLSLPLRLQYWSGKSWVLTSDDTCTSIPAAAVARSNAVQSNGSVASWTSTVSAVTLSGGVGNVTLTSPSGGGTGSMDVALNLGSTTLDLSCLTGHPASTGAGVPWLRARAGSCAATQDRDPSARATFGVFAPETRKAIHLRELF